MLHTIQELHLYAAIKVMDKLEPPLEKVDPNPNLNKWLDDIKLSQSIVDSILSLNTHTDSAVKARYFRHNIRITVTSFLVALLTDINGNDCVQLVCLWNM